MIITFKDPGWDYTSLWITGSILAVFVIVALILTVYRASRRGSTESLDEWIFAMWMISVCWLLLGVFLVGTYMMGAEIYEDRVDTALTEALSEAGYEEISLGTGDFTASDDGKYFHGFLVELEAPAGEIQYQIAEAAK